MYLADRCYTLTYIDVIYLIFALRGKICDNTFQIYFFIDIWVVADQRHPGRDRCDAFLNGNNDCCHYTSVPSSAGAISANGMLCPSRRTETPSLPCSAA